jgi:hypothetical protein
MNDFRRVIATLFLSCIAVCGAQAADNRPADKAAVAKTERAPPRAALRPASEAWPDRFIYNDTCNVFVLRDGAAAILFNLGDGGVLDHFGEIGVRRVNWIIFTDHHREQCQGIGRVPAGLQIVPLDITLDGTRQGQLFDFLLQATPPPE